MKSTALMLCSLLACLPLLSAAAELSGSDNAWNFDFSGSQRSRFSSVDNQFRPGLGGGDQAASIRTLVRLQADKGPLSLVTEIQDSRNYFNDDGSALLTIEINALEPLQLYAGYRFENALRDGDTLDVKAGRFTTGFGSRRLVARHGFRNVIQNYDGIQADWRQGGTSLSAFWTMPVKVRPANRQDLLDNKVLLDTSDESLQLHGIFFSRPLAAENITLEAYLYGLEEQDNGSIATTDRELFTPGFRLLKPPQAGNWDFELEGAWQWGSRRATAQSSDTQTLDVSAHLLFAELGFSFDTRWQPRLSLEWTRASGDRQPGDTEYERFDRLFGPRREFGPTGIFGMLGHNNLHTTALRLVLTGERADWMVSVRDANLASATDSFATSGIRDASGAAGKDAGLQYEFRHRYWLVPQKLRLETGGAVFQNGGFLDRAPNATGEGDSSYVYGEFTYFF